MPSRAFILRVNWIACGLCAFVGVEGIVMGNKIVALAGIFGIATTIYNRVWVFRRWPPR